ncbi:MAG: TIGR03088 family PEP-CTERM/XrtA system glycosyltransferase, partial [Herbaspirillum sp.]
AIVCLTEYTVFSEKITKPDVPIFALHKKPGLDLGMHIAIWRLLRKLKPAILHTYNLSTIEYVLVAKLAGVRVKVHAEHGREATDPNGENRKHNLLRRLLIPCIDAFVPVSLDLQQWLKHVIHVPDKKNCLINNGVDTIEFTPADDPRSKHTIPFGPNCFIIGTVGRLQAVKCHTDLIDAFALLLKSAPMKNVPLRLAIIGDGPLSAVIKNKIEIAGITDKVWLPGARTDIAKIMQDFSVFVLPSLAEGTPVTILEAMATGLPIVATQVGGIPEVVLDQQTGTLVPPSNPCALATAIATYVDQPLLATLHGAAGRRRIEQKYSVDAMLRGYTELYDDLCTRKKIKERHPSCAE